MDLGRELRTVLPNKKFIVLNLIVRIIILFVYIAFMVHTNKEMGTSSELINQIIAYAILFTIPIILLIKIVSLARKLNKQLVFYENGFTYTGKEYLFESFNSIRWVKTSSKLIIYPDYYFYFYSKKPKVYLTDLYLQNVHKVFNELYSYTKEC